MIQRKVVRKSMVVAIATTLFGLNLAPAARAFSSGMGLGARILPSGVTFQPPPDARKPRRTMGGASRGECPAIATEGLEGTALKSAVPVVPSSGYGLTASERPIFWIHIRSAASSQAIWTLEDSTGKHIYQTQVNIPTTPSTIGIQLPENAPALAMDRDYRWSLTVECPQANSDSVDIAWERAEGWVRRTGQPAGSIASESGSLSQAERYGEAGLWYEMLEELARLRRQQPNNPDLDAAWQAVLVSQGFEADVVDAPMILVRAER